MSVWTLKTIQNGHSEHILNNVSLIEMHYTSLPWEARPSMWLCFLGKPARPLVTGCLHWMSSTGEKALIQCATSQTVPSMPTYFCQARASNTDLGNVFFPHVMPHTIASDKATHYSAKGEGNLAYTHRSHWSHPHNPTDGAVKQPTEDWVTWSAVILWETVSCRFGSSGSWPWEGD